MTCVGRALSQGEEAWNSLKYLIWDCLRWIVKVKSCVTNSPLYRGMSMGSSPPEIQKEENNVKFKNDINRFIWKE